MSQVHLEGLACCSALQGSLGNGWLLHPCLWYIKAYHFIPQNCDYALDVHVFFTCIIVIRSMGTVTISSPCLPPCYLMILQCHLLSHSPPNTCRHPSPSKQQLQGCEPWDELSRQKHRGKVYGQSVYFSWQIQSRDFSFSRWQVSSKTVSASQNILYHLYLTALLGLLARPSYYCHMCLRLSLSTWIVWTDFIRTTHALKAHYVCKR